MHVERLLERLEDFISAAEQREIELRGIRDELRRIANAVEELSGKKLYPPGP